MHIFTSIFLAIGILGAFFLPGFLLNKLLGKNNSLATSFIISLVLLFHIIFLIGLAEIRITVFSVGISITVLNILLYVLCVYLKIDLSTEQLEYGFSLKKKDLFWLSPALLSVFLMLLKSSVFQIPHGDQDFRWFFLSRQILKYGTFSFYPPLTDLDYERYFFTDSFSPIVSFSYLWLFALYGSGQDFLVFVPVTLQYIFLLIFGYKLAKEIYGKDNDGLIAIMILSSSTLLFYSIAICQETGLTALSLIALAYFLYKKEIKWQDTCLASFATALGALSREYGGILVICGIIIIFCRKNRITVLKHYLLFCFVLIAPWYLRVFILTGNPFYSNPFLGLPVNLVHANILNGYKESIGLHTYMNWKIVAQILKEILVITGFPFVTGFLSFCFRPKDLSIPLICLIFIGLWLYSLPIVPAGLFHSMRILSPAIAILSISAVKIFRLTEMDKGEKMKITLVLLMIVTTITFIQNIVVPLNPLKINKENILLATSVVPDTINLEKETIDILSMLPENSLILSDGALQHAYLEKNKDKFKNIVIIPVWAPKVHFLFNEENDFQKASELLKKSGIKYVMMGHKGNLNMNYLKKFDFFRQYPLQSKIIVDGFLYELTE